MSFTETASKRREQIAVGLEDELIEQVDRLAKAESLSRSAWIRRVVALHVRQLVAA